ncbi:MAG: hypothetical protein FJ271_03935 [Planctomycetes bacterium]|nr:hypothetical protein [Planctomycetota bacterium]
MTHMHCLIPLLLFVAEAISDAPTDASVGCQTKAEAGRPASCGYLADAEVFLGGVTRRGRIIVTPDGCVHLEHLDEQARRWVYGVIRRESSTPNGWDDRARRAGPPQRVWGQVGGNVVLAEIHTPDASIKVSRHQLLSTR